MAKRKVTGDSVVEEDIPQEGLSVSDYVIMYALSESMKLRGRKFT